MCCVTKVLGFYLGERDSTLCSPVETYQFHIDGQTLIFDGYHIGYHHVAVSPLSNLREDSLDANHLMEDTLSTMRFVSP